METQTVKAEKISMQRKEEWQVSSNELGYAFMWINVTLDENGEVVGVIIRRGGEETWITRLELEALAQVLQNYKFKL